MKSPIIVSLKNTEIVFPLKNSAICNANCGIQINGTMIPTFAAKIAAVKKSRMDLVSNTDWIDGTRIQRWAQEKNLAVVMPAGENRFYVDNPREGAYFGEYIGRELVEMTRKMFPLSEKREDTFIAGLSMGGYGAIRNGLKYHKTFSHIAGLSSGIMLEDILNSTNEPVMPFMRRSYYESVFGDLSQLEGSDMDYKALICKLKEEKADIPKIYLCCGTEDFLLKYNRDYRDLVSNTE